MRSVLSVFLLGVLVGVAGHWYFTRPDAPRTVAEVRDTVNSNAVQAERAIKDRVDTEAIKDQMERGGRAVRDKVSQAGEIIADATADARITATVKAKLIANTRLEGLKINVDTTDGVVTLSGSVSAPEEISEAMRVAQEVKGVKKVTSTLQVNPK